MFPDGRGTTEWLKLLMVPCMLKLPLLSPRHLGNLCPGATKPGPLIRSRAPFPGIISSAIPHPPVTQALNVRDIPLGAIVPNLVSRPLSRPGLLQKALPDVSRDIPFDIDRKLNTVLVLVSFRILVKLLPDIFLPLNPLRILTTLPHVAVKSPPLLELATVQIHTAYDSLV